MKRLLYITVNDGTDTRVVKELKTLSNGYRVTLVRFGGPKLSKHLVQEDLRLKGGYTNLFGLLRLWLKVLMTLLRTRFHMVHVVDEECLLLLWLPLLFVRGHLRLDIFDSWFLKRNCGPSDALLFRKLLYCRVDSIIVTDENRKHLLPSFLNEKAKVVPNVPISSECDFGVKNLALENTLVIAFVGSLSRRRGIDVLDSLLKQDEGLTIVCMGWIYDDYTKIWIDSWEERIIYLGTRSQRECNDYIHKNAHYLFCYYSDDNLNNLNASPNKIYDSIHTSTPCLINSSPKVAEMVSRMNIGIVYDKEKPDLTIRSMYDKYSSFFDSDLTMEEFTWEFYEDKLLNYE